MASQCQISRTRPTRRESPCLSTRSRSEISPSIQVKCTSPFDLLSAQSPSRKPQGTSPHFLSVRIFHFPDYRRQSRAHRFLYRLHRLKRNSNPGLLPSLSLCILSRAAFLSISVRPSPQWQCPSPDEIYSAHEGGHQRTSRHRSRFRRPNSQGLKINYVTRDHRSTPDQGRRLRRVDAQKTYLPNYGLAITAFSL